VPVLVNVHHGYAFGRVGRLEKFVLEQADAVICNSSFTRRWVLNSTRPKYCKIVPMGVDTDRFVPPAEREQKEKKIVFSMGRMIPLKGLKYLILALAQLQERKKDLHLLLAGDGPDRRELEDLVKEQGLKASITFLGRIPNEKAVEYLHQADCFVLPSIIDEQGNTEGLGVVLLEAMACKVPCIGSKVGGIPDVIRDGENGFLVEERDVQALADKIGLLTQDNGLCRKMGKQAREFVVDNFDWKGQAGNLLQVYNNLI
jgi:glycosyltransferase involved in cell wall biosynthesis